MAVYVVSDGDLDGRAMSVAVAPSKPRPYENICATPWSELNRFLCFCVFRGSLACRTVTKQILGVGEALRVGSRRSL